MLRTDVRQIFRDEKFDSSPQTLLAVIIHAMLLINPSVLLLRVVSLICKQRG